MRNSATGPFSAISTASRHDGRNDQTLPERRNAFGQEQPPRLVTDFQGRCAHHASGSANAELQSPQTAISSDGDCGRVDIFRVSPDVLAKELKHKKARTTRHRSGLLLFGFLHTHKILKPNLDVRIR
jgi:hypothetical protein